MADRNLLKMGALIANARFEGVRGLLARRLVGFLALSIVSLALSKAPLGELLRLSLHDERYSHILVVPIISALLIWLNREVVFAESRSDVTLGISILASAFGIGLVKSVLRLPMAPIPDIGFSISILGAVLILPATFVMFYGRQSFVAALFPFLLLLIVVPVPAGMMDAATIALQKGSAEMSYGLFKLAGVPVFRDGFKFSLPGADIEVAEECSGIRSSLSLLICSVLVGHLLLRSWWSRLSFTLLTIPIVIFKNAVRIVTISWLGIYIDKGFFFGNLHHYGGLPFSLLAIAILYGVLRVLLMFGPPKRIAGTFGTVG